MNKRLFLIDGNSFCYRAYYAIRSLSNSKGQPTNAVYGFVTMLNKLIKEERPDYLAVCFDLKGPTFRHKIHKEYKIQRKPMPDDLIIQMPIIKEMVAAYGIPIFEKEGYEADDIIATISKKAEKRSIETNIMTGDKDILQLVGPHTVVHNTHKEGLIYDEQKVIERFGVRPEHIIDIMALMGDQSDNYKGVPGIGEVAACELIKEFGSIDNLYDNIDKVKREGWRNILLKHKEDARISRELATLDTDVPIEIDFEALALREPHADKLMEIFRELEFKSLLKEFMPDDEWEADYKTVRTKDEFKKLAEELAGKKEIALDFETTGTDPLRAEIVGVSFSWKEKEAYYIPIKNDKEETLDEQYVLKALKNILEDDKIKKVGQNIKYEKLILLNHGIELGGIHFDTMIASYLLNPSRPGHNLGDIAIEYLGHKMTPITDLIGTGRKAVTMDKVDIDRVSRYCCQDSDATLRIKNLLKVRLKEHELDGLFFDIEMPLVDVLAAMEFKGIAIDAGLLKEMSGEMEKAIEKSGAAVHEMCGCEFNINSPKQLGEILFDKLHLPVIKRTKTGISTDEEVLRRLSVEHAVPAAILEYRELVKLKSTYIDNLPALLNPRTNRIHTSFNQTVTATGRLSSSDPNLQNIPIKREMGRKVRQAFIVGSDDCVLLSSDYSQIELRVLAHLSGDQKLVDAFKNGRDIHTFTASLVYGVPEDKVTDQMRSQAKTVNFGIIYGMSAFGLSKSLEIEPQKAQSFIDSYFDMYSGVKRYLETCIEEARTNGYVATIMKRKRFIPDIASENTKVRQFAERTAINTPIQGSAADIIKVAMVNIYQEFRKKKIKSSMILQVHDELVFEVFKDELRAVMDIVRDKMEDVTRMKVPIKTNMAVGKNWLDLKAVE